MVTLIIVPIANTLARTLIVTIRIHHIIALTAPLQDGHGEGEVFSHHSSSRLFDIFEHPVLGFMYDHLYLMKYSNN